MEDPGAATELQALPSAAQAAPPALYMPVMSVDEAIERRNILRELISKQYLVKGVDYEDASERYKRGGEERLVLLKPGAEKLAVFFGYVSSYSVVDKIEDFNPGGVVAYTYKCTMMRGGEPVSEADGSANSRETKYRWRWVSREELDEMGGTETFGSRDSTKSEFGFSVDESKTVGEYSKPAEYWQEFKSAITAGTAKKIQKKTRAGKTYPGWEIASVSYKIENPDFPDLANTILKIAQKRAMVSAVMAAVGCSEFFTVDIEVDTPPTTGDAPPQQTEEPPPSAQEEADKTITSAELKKQAASLKQNPINVSGGHEPNPGEEPVMSPTGVTAMAAATAREAFRALCNKLRITAKTKPSLVDLSKALAVVLEIENVKDADPAALLGKIQKLDSMEMIKAIEAIKTAAGLTPTKIEPEDTAAPMGAAKPPEDAISLEQFRTLNIGGMVATLTRNRLQGRAAEIHGYILTTLNIEKIPFSDPKIEKALSALYGMNDTTLNEELKKGGTT